VAIGDSDVVRAVLGRDEPEASQALADGKVVLLAADLVNDGQAELTTYLGEAGARHTTAPAIEFTAQAFLPHDVPGALMSPQMALQLGIPEGAPVALIDTKRMPSSREEQKARAALDGLGGGYLYVERGFKTHTAPEVLALLAMSIVVTFGATAVATGLAAAEGRSDLQTLGVVGAGPHVGRGLAMAQAATIAWIGALLGVVAGLVPALAVLSARQGYPLVLPWTTIGVGVVAVPLLAAILAGLMGSSRLPAARRSW
jgi:putative ABC transport system permease protein